eukprot:8047383-Pyramimonas_sp.AAC.1
MLKCCRTAAKRGASPRGGYSWNEHRSRKYERRSSEATRKTWTSAAHSTSTDHQAGRWAGQAEMTIVKH